MSIEKELEKLENYYHVLSDSLSDLQEFIEGRKKNLGRSVRVDAGRINFYKRGEMIPATIVEEREDGYLVQTSGGWLLWEEK